MRITSIKHITGGNWLVVYFHQLPCMCREVRGTIKIESKEKPTEEEVLKILRNEDND